MSFSLFSIKINLYLNIVILESGVERLIFEHCGFVLEVFFEVLNKLLPHLIFYITVGAVFVFVLQGLLFFLLDFSRVIDLEELQ